MNRGRIGVAFVALALTAAAIAPLAAASGVPAFQHDWIWPGSRGQCAAWGGIGLTAWQSSAGGYPSSFPTPWFAYGGEALLCLLAGPHLALACELAALLLAAAIAVVRAAGALGVEAPLPRAVAAALAVANPYVVDHVQAGHVHALAAYAGLAALLAALLVEAPWWAIALAAAVAGAQHQLFVSGIAAALLLVALAPRSAPRVGAGLIAGTLIAASAWTVGLTAGAGGFDLSLPTRHWELSQSAPLVDTLRGIGYIGGYDRRFGPLAPLLWVPPLLAALALLRARRDARIVVLAALCLVGALLASGLDGPLAPQLDFAFAHLRIAAAFRELAQFLAVASLAGAILAAVALAPPWPAIPRRLLAALALIVAARWSLLVTAGIPHLRPAEPIRHIARALAAAAPGTRYLVVPASGTRLAVGHSAFDLPIAGHASADGCPVCSEPDAFPKEAGRAAAIAVTVARPEVPAWSADDLEPALAQLWRRLRSNVPPTLPAADPRARLVAVLPYVQTPGGIPAPDAATAARLVSGGTPLTLFRYDDGADAERGWTRSALLPLLPAWLTHPDGILTLRARAALPLDGPAWVVVASAAGDARVAGCALARTIDLHARLFRCFRAAPVATGTPPLIAYAAVGGGTQVGAGVRTGAAGSAQVLSDETDAVRLRVTARAGSALLLRERFDPGWTAAGRSWEHVAVDGGLNAWIVPAELDGIVELRYAPRTLHRIALIVSVAVLVLCLGAGLRSRRYVAAETGRARSERSAGLAQERGTGAAG